MGTVCGVNVHHAERVDQARSCREKEGKGAVSEAVLWDGPENLVGAKGSPCQVSTTMGSAAPVSGIVVKLDSMMPPGGGGVLRRRLLARVAEDARLLRRS